MPIRHYVMIQTTHRYPKEGVAQIRVENVCNPLTGAISFSVKRDALRCCEALAVIAHGYYSDDTKFVVHSVRIDPTTKR
jgi:hypothetical protein